MKTDIQIAQEATMLPIKDVAANYGITEDDLELYGKYKAKFSDEFMNSLDEKPDGKLVLMTAINPTPAGEGKTTTSIGLAQAFEKLGKKSVLALREPSLGPCFGIKGGAAGGGYSQVVPMEDLNLHFTGDFHAITSANNLLAALLDNHIQQGNELRIDTRQVIWKRCMDMNDRALRNIVIGLGRKVDGYVREDHFVITVATEIMAILCLAEDIKDLKARLAKIIVAYDVDGNPVTAGQLNAVGSMAALLKDAIKPNMVQTLEHTGAIVHGGPFANIAHGCNSVRATKMALKLSDIAITEAGFGADLGAEKFMDIKCRMAGLKPDAVVLVATVRALKYNGGVPKTELVAENLDALKKGICNLEKHIENLQKFGVPIVVTLNAFETDTEKEHEFIRQFCEERGCEFALSEVWAKGGEGGIDLAKKVLKTLEEKESNFKVLYPDNLSLKEKVETIAKEIYGADGVTYEPAAEKMLAKLTDLGFGDLPVCMAKNQYSLSDDPTLLGRPSGFELNVREVYVSAGAGFVVVLTGAVMTIGRRAELLRWAEREPDRYLIEDDYDSEFRYRGKPIPSLQSSDEKGKVIYIGTFSKAIAPAIRVSYMVLPGDLLDIYRRDCSFYSCTVSRIDQRILNEFIRDGYFERHLNKMRMRYRAKHDLLLAGLEPFKKQFVISGEDAGLHLLLTAKGNVTEQELLERAAAEKVKAYGMSENMVEATMRKATVLLGFGSIDEAEMQEGLRRLQKAWL